MRRQIHISVEVYDAEGHNTDSIEEVEYVISDEANTEDMHRIFMGIAHFLGYDITSMEELSCDFCDICEQCEIKEDTSNLNALEEELNGLKDDNDVLRTKNAELEKKLDDFNMACFSAGESCDPCPAPAPIPKLGPRKDLWPDVPRKMDWY